MQRMSFMDSVFNLIFQRGSTFLIFFLIFAMDN